MATVIDTLVVALGFDASQFSAGVSKANKDTEKMTGAVGKTSKTVDNASKKAAAHGKQLGQMAGQGVKAFNDMKTAAVSMFASYLTATGIEKLITGLTSANAKLGYMSKNLGIASQEIKAWSNVAEQTGGTAAGMQKDMTSLTRSMIDFKQTGNYSAMLSGLGAIGVGIQDAQGHAKSATQVMLDLSDRVKGMSRPDASAFLSSHVGLDEGTINTILLGRDALEKQLAAQKDNAEAAAANTENAIKLEKAQAEVKEKFEATANTLLTQLTPYLIQAAQWMERNSSTVLAFAAGIGTLIVAVSSISIAITIFETLAAVVSVAGIVLELLCSPVGLVVAAIALLAAGIVYAYKHYEKFANIIDRALDWLGFGKNIDGATWSFGKLKQNVIDLANSIWTQVKPVFDWFSGVLDKIWSGDFKGAVSMVASGVADVAVAAGNAVVDAVKGNGVATNVRAGYREGSTGEKTEGANEVGVPYQAGQFVGKAGNWAHSEFGNLLSHAESKSDYSAYNRTKGGLKSFYKTDLTSKTVGEVMAMQSRRDVFAAGRYQMIPDTLKGGVAALGINKSAKFDSAMQDKLFNEYLVKIKRPEIGKYLSGDGDIHKAMYSWAQEFASAGVEGGRKISKGRIARGGESYYAGDGLNKAGISLEKMRAALEASRAPAMRQLPTGAQLSRPVIAAGAQNRTNTNSSETHIGQVVVNTQATDAKGTANALVETFRRQGLIAQANTGMS
jgi:hypothetical protein